jgi:hypothetical protein
MAKRIQKTEETFVSVVMITDQSTVGVAEELKELHKLVQPRYSNYEIILVDSQLPPAEMQKVVPLLKKIPCVRVLLLSQPYTKDVCVFAGLETAIGDVVVVRSPSDPLSLIPTFADEAHRVDVVFGVSDKKFRRGFLNLYGARAFYWYNRRFLRISIPENSTYFMAFSRRAVNALTRSRRFARHIRYLARQIGYQSKEIRYTPTGDFLQAKKSIKELLVSALELATNYSKHPMRFLAWLGFAAALVNLLYAGYVIAVNLVKSRVAEGWTTLSLQSAGMFFLLFAILAVLCEYIGRILEETREEPAYHISEELVSTVSIADNTRRNIAR